MTSVRLNVGIGKSDRIQPLLDGEIDTPGLDLRFDLSAADNVFWRALHSDDFDITEMSLAAFCILTSRNEHPFVGIPVFTSRMFRHSSVYIRTDAGISRPGELKGKRIGIPEYQMTAVVWIRGVLDNDYDVSPKDIDWYRGGVGKPGRVERIPLRVSADYRITDIPKDATLDGYLLDGRIDAIISAEMPPSFLKGNPRIARLFPDFRQAEMDYYSATKIFPIAHVLVLRRGVYEKNPELALRVYDAFEHAKRVSAARLYDTDTLPYMVPWLVAEMEQTFSILGRDYWAYGIDQNRPCLETFLQVLRRHDLIEKDIAVEDLFAIELKST